MIMRATKGRSGHVSQEQIERSIDREDAELLRSRAAEAAALAQGTPIRSLSIVKQRCATCGQWPRFNAQYGPRVCFGDGGYGHPFVASVATGAAPVQHGTR
jgi:hypothetical protein